MSAAQSPVADESMAVELPSISLREEERIPDLINHENVLLHSNVEQKCPIIANESVAFRTPNLPKAITPLQLNSHVTKKRHFTMKLMPSGGCGNVSSPATDTVDGLCKYKLTDQQRNELTSIFQKMGQPSPSVVLDVASRLDLNPVAVEKFFRCAKRMRRASRAGTTDAESILMERYSRPVENVGPDSLEGSSNRMASSTFPLGDDSTGQNLCSVRVRCDALRRRVADVPSRLWPEAETIRRGTKNKCSALSDGVQECCGCCHDICLCTCLLCCLFCCCCCIFCYNAAAPNRPIVF